MIDMVVPRGELKEKLALLDLLSRAGGQRRRPDGRLRALGASRRPGAARPARRCCRPPATGSGSSASPRCSTGSAGRRTGCRRSSTSPGPTARARPVAFLRAALEAAGTRSTPSPARTWSASTSGSAIAGRLIDDEAAGRAARPKCSTPATGIEPSFFEVATAAALLAFARTPADACILEVGLGGRLDATNVIERPLVTGDRQPRLDHQQFLGDGLTDIAGEKAGIAKPGVPLVTQLYPPAIADAHRRDRAASGARRGSPRGGAWDAIVRGGQAPLSRRAGRARPAAAAPARPASGDECRARRRDAAPPGQAARARVGAQRGDGLGRLAGAASAARARAAGRRPRSLARRRPQSVGRAADRELRRSARSPTASRCTSIFASLATKDPAGMLEPFTGIAARGPHRADPRPRLLHARRPRRDCRRARLQRRAASTTSPTALGGACPTDARVLIFGSLYLAGEVLAANDQVPD